MEKMHGIRRCTALRLYSGTRMRIYAYIRVVCLAEWVVYPDGIYINQGLFHWPWSSLPLYTSPSLSWYLRNVIYQIAYPRFLHSKKDKILTATTMEFSNILQAVLLLGATPALVHTANCNPGANNWGVSTSQYQQAASSICNGGTDVETFFGSVGGGTGRYVKSWFNGSKGSRSQCWVTPPHFRYWNGEKMLGSTPWRGSERKKTRS